MSDPTGDPQRRLECVGKSSKVPSKDTADVEAPGLWGSRGSHCSHSGDPAVNKSAHRKAVPLKPHHNAVYEGKRPSAGQANGHLYRSEAYDVLHNESIASRAIHRREKLPKLPIAGAEKNTDADAAGSVGRVSEPEHKVPQYQEQPKCSPKESMNEAESGDEECGEDEEAESGDEECEEDEEAESGDEQCGKDALRAPIELLAEFLKAVMESNYPLAKKLCQMILIYEPEKPEAKIFLPLIEERLLTEEAQKGSSNAGNKSDNSEEEADSTEEEDGEDEDGGADDDDDDDEDSNSSDSDEEFSDSSSSSSES